MASTVGLELLDEIERVAAKRARWTRYQRDMGSAGASLDIGIALMTRAIEAGKAAIASDDGAAAIAALQDLRDFDGND